MEISFSQKATVIKPMLGQVSSIDRDEVFLQSSCNVASPNINSGRRLCLTRHPQVHLAAAAQPLFDPRGIEHRRPEDEKGKML
ncbi:hypothetical protein TNCV_857281 [Trichonephila clavipes]|nr:hypothetical protein TNCV_857281 [Trichonephila clavipes]